MECDRAREAISARIDGEDPGVPDGALEAHLAGCAACRDWQQRAHVMTRRARLGGTFLDRDLTDRVLPAFPAATGGRRLRLGLRLALLTVALVQLSITVPLLILGHDHDAGGHAAHELGSFDLALAVAFAVGAIRPRLSSGLAWTCGIAAVGLAGTAIADLIGGQAIGADEAQHLIAVAGAALLLWQARALGTGTIGAGTADATDWTFGTRSSPAADPGTISQFEARPRSPRRGGAARVSAPDPSATPPATDPPDAAEHAGADGGPSGATQSRARRGGKGKEAVA